MSFTGAGPLGSYAWGTTTTQALQNQYKEIKEKYTELQTLIKNNKADFPAQAFPELGSTVKPDTKILNLNTENGLAVWPAAVFTANEIETWPSDKRAAIAYRKKEFSDQPKDIVDATNEFKAAALQSLQKRHTAIESLSSEKRAVIHKAAEWFTAIVVNMYLRELLVYPLVRDQLKATTFYTQALDRDDRIRDILRDIRKAIYTNAESTSWTEQVTQAFNLWEKEYQQEEQEWIPKLVNYLEKAEMSALRDICASHANPGIQDPVPATNHNLNYGQQLSQMFRILSLYFSRTGNMQGIPRPRHEIDWSCADGVEPTRRPTYDDIDGQIGVPPVGTGRGIPELKEFPEPKNFGTELPPATLKDVATIGTSINRVVNHPDAQSLQIRAEFTAENEQRVKETLVSIEKARLTKYGTLEAEKAAKDAHKIVVAGERAESIKEYLRDEPHSTDTEGSYYWNEVQLAFRNHGTHWETLSQDITPLGHHYLLIHYDVQFFKSTVDNYRLKVFGCVTNPVVLTLQQIKDMGKDATFSTPMVMECSGNGRAMMKPRYNQHVPWGLQAFGCYCWTGTPLRVLLDRVGVTSDCIDVVFTGYDAGLEKEKEIRYFSHALNIHDPVIDHAWLIWMNNGVDLLPEHGYPLRLMVPAWYGNVNIKWLRSIEFVPRKFKGVYQRTYSYTKTPTDNDIAVPSTELRPRAMVAPIGYPDFTTRKRTAIAGSHRFHGKCWVGGGHYRAIILVELSLDGGKTWLPCELEPRIGINAWANFSLTLDLPVGLYTVVVRAMDNVGQRQQMKLDWNYASMQDDAMQIYELTIVDSLSVVE